MEHIADRYGSPGFPQRSRWRTGLPLVALLFFALSSAYAALAMVTQVDQLLLPSQQLNLPLSLPGVQDAPDALAAEDERINILVVGLDRRPGEDENGFYRSDSIIVLTIHPNAKKAAMLSFPRDLWVQIPLPKGGVTEGRINEAYEIGELLRDREGYKGGGPQVLKDTMRHNFGIDVDNYVVLDFVGFTEIIDALGGVSLYVPEHIAYYYSTTDNPKDHYWFEIDPGYYLFTGENALAYSRYRNDSDLYRIERQQRVIFAAVNKALSINALSRAPQLWDKYNEAIRTDISAFRVPGLALAMKGINTDNIESYSLGNAVDGFTTLGGASVLRLLPDKGADVIGSAFRPPAVRKENAKVMLYSGDGREQNLKQAELFLRLQGIVEGNLTRAKFGAGEQPAQPVVLYRSDAKITARFLARWLRLGDSIREATLEEQARYFTDGARVAVLLGSETPSLLGAFPGTDGGAAPASRYTGAGAPPSFNPYQPPPSYFAEPPRSGPTAPRSVPTAQPQSTPSYLPPGVPITPVPTIPPPTPTPKNPFG